MCALPIELAAARKMLDEEHEDLQQDEYDDNLYAFGRIGNHNVVLTCLPAGQTGTNSAAAAAKQLKATFKWIRFGLMVGIGGGVPGKEDIRLGDVVVSKPYQGHGGVIQYDFGKVTPTGFQQTGFLNSPPRILLNAVTIMQTNHILRRSKLSEYVETAQDIPEFTRDHAGSDILYDVSYNHVGGDSCEGCDADKVVVRQPRKNNKIVVHYGTIASGNQVMRYGTERDEVSRDFGGVLCFEMEAAGLMNSFPCLAIRGICDYADSHKNKEWQPYAAVAAAACAKELLLVIPPAEVVKVPTAEEATRAASVNNYYYSNAEPRRRKIMAPDEVGEAAKEVVERLQRGEGADVDTQGTKGEKALFAAAVNGSEAVVRLLLDKGVNINSRGGGIYYPTALHGAAQLGQESVVKLLLEKGADVALLNEDRRTPLHTAARFGQKAVVELLLNHSIKEIKNMDRDGRTAQGLAGSWGHPAVAKVLREWEKAL